MAASSESGCSSKVRYYYETRVFTPENVDDDDPDSSFKAAHPIAAAAASPGTACSSSVLFKVQSILRLSVAGGNPMTEFLEENDWRETRQSSLELPCSKDGIIIDDKDNLKIISEALTALRVLKVSHQSIMDQLRQGAASLGLSPKFVVEICEVTHVTLPLIDEEGKRFMEEGETVLIPHNGDDEGDSVLIPENGDDEGQAVLIPDNDSEERIKKEELESLFALKILILDLGDINENDEAAKINDWFSEFINALCRVAWPEEEEQYEQEEEGEGDREEDGEEEEEGEGEGEGEEEEWVCPICWEIFKQDEPWSEMPCCSKAFHRDCISMWNTERVKKCPWCRSSLPLVLQSAKGVIHRSNSEYFSSPIQPGFDICLVALWHLLEEVSVWSKEKLHIHGCDCGCLTRRVEIIVI